ncbi:hypothetical protein KPA09_11020, partial [Staphylococcus hominis]
IRKVTAQRAENNQKNYKKDNFYIISIEIVFFHLSRYFMSQPLVVDNKNEVMYDILRDYSLTHSLIPVEA